MMALTGRASTSGKLIHVPVGTALRGASGVGVVWQVRMALPWSTGKCPLLYEPPPVPWNTDADNFDT